MKSSQNPHPQCVGASAEYRSNQFNETQKIGYLDGWRGVAILLVLVGHFFPLPGIDLGGLGVNWFFVLSGLFMSKLLFVRQIPLDLFYRRRITRIFPVFYTFLFLSLAAALVAGQLIETKIFVATFFSVRNYVWPEAQSGVMVTGHLWSLAVEEQSYVILSLLAITARKTRLKVVPMLSTLILLCAGAILYCQFFLHDNLALYKASLHAEYAGLGIFASALAMLTIRPFRAAKWLVPLLIISGSFLHWWRTPPALQMLAGVGALAIAVNLLTEAPTWLRNCFNVRPLRLLGTWSYSLYIWQQPFHASGLSRPIALAGAIAVGLISYYCLEQPIRKWLNEIWANDEADIPTKATV